MKNILFKTILTVYKNKDISKEVKHTITINVSNRLRKQHSNYRKFFNITKLL